MVAIKDFGMPSCCENCDMCVPDYSDDRGLYYCVITEEPCREYQDNRQLSCPLIEIGTCKDCKQLGVMDCGYYCKLNHWGKISTESNCGGMGDWYCADFERRN